MYFWKQFLVFLLCVTMQILAARQFCGSDLADVMALVCKGRGYNMAFKADVSDHERRYKRGIVDECCRRGCTWSTLETYCSPETTDIQIRKRSDFTDQWLPETTEAKIESHDIHFDRNEMKVIPEIDNHRNKKYNALEKKKIAHQNRYYSLWEGFNRQVPVPRGPSIVNKVKRNDIDDGKSPRLQENINSLADPVKWQDLFIEGIKSRNEKSEEVKSLEITTVSVPIRHRHRKYDLTRKMIKENSITYSQIGTIPPYFQGRTLVLPPSRKNLK